MLGSRLAYCRTNIELYQAVSGQKMIVIKHRLRTNDVVLEDGDIVLKHAWFAGMVY